MSALLRRIEVDEVRVLAPAPIDPETLAAARAIVEAVRAEGWPAVQRLAAQYDDREPDAPWVYDRAALQGALASLAPADRALLERVAERVRRFAMAQRGAFTAIDVRVPGGRAGHELEPVERAGCYAPGGRHPLPSSVLMTAVTARAAGVDSVWVASPRPAPITLAAAAVAGADALLAVGGAHAIAALAYGVGPVPKCDVLAGPGNRFVAAAKQIVSGEVGIDLPAGPSELLVIADASADAEAVAADLLAQAEHDADARPMLLALDAGWLAKVEIQLERQLADLPTAETARAALAEGWCAVARDVEEACACSDRVAPEHLQLQLEPERSRIARARLRHFGALFTGGAGAEVLGDYGAGPNHCLPTGGAARFTGGLSVLNFLRVRTWLATDPGSATAALATDAARLAELEGLAGHARAARLRANETSRA